MNLYEEKRRLMSERYLYGNKVGERYSKLGTRGLKLVIYDDDDTELFVKWMSFNGSFCEGGFSTPSGIGKLCTGTGIRVVDSDGDHRDVQITIEAMTGKCY